MHIRPQTLPEDNLAHSLIQPVADLSLARSGSCISSAALACPPSYDSTSPSYDLGAASPCNPFPSSSPFFASFPCPAMTGSRLRFEEARTGENGMHAAAQQPQPHPPPTVTALAHIPPPHSAPGLRRTKPCRFFLSPAGCKTGRWCNFKHPVRAPDDDEPVTHNASRKPPHDGTLEALRAAVVRSRKPADGGETNVSAWDNVPDVRDLDPDWGKKPDGDSDVHPKWRSEYCMLSTSACLSRYSLLRHPPARIPANPHMSSSPTLPKLPPRPLPLRLQVPVHTRARAVRGWLCASIACHVAA